MINMKRTIIIGVSLFFLPLLWNGAEAGCQDIHFSQFYQTPLLINPALSGAIDGNIRAMANYKNQWGSITTPYVTSALSIDGVLLKQKRPGSHLGTGLQFFNDKAGDTQLGITQVNLSLSGIVSLNDNQKVSAGLSGGFVQRSINTSSSVLKWDNQYDGIGQNKSVQPNETITGDAYYYGDFAAGAAWSFATEASTLSAGNHVRVNAGAAYYHINKPVQQFKGNEPLDGKIVLHASGNIGLKNTWLSFAPSVLFAMQGPLKEINVGTLARYTLKEESKYTGIFKESAVLLGGHYRVGDAFIPAVMLEYANYAVGISYDINLSALRTASSARGGIEISLRYINPNPFKQGRQKSVRFL